MFLESNYCLVDELPLFVVPLFESGPELSCLLLFTFEIYADDFSALPKFIGPFSSDLFVF